MTPAQKRVLLVVADHGPLPATEISFHLYGHAGYRGRVETMCGALEANGLLTFGRRVGWKATTAGRREAAAMVRGA